MVVGCALAASAGAAYRIDPFVVNGDTVPSGGTIDPSPWSSRATPDGRVLIQGPVNGLPVFRSEAYLHDGDAAELLLAEGDPAPNGGVFTSFDMRISPGGALAFWAAVDDTVLGVFRLSGGAATELARTGGAAPPAGSSYAHIGMIQDVSDAGLVLFYATLDTPSGLRDGWILDDGGVQQVVALEGDATPAGGTFDDIPGFGARVFADGSVLFQATVTGGSSPEGLFRFRAGGLASELLAGDPVPTPGGGTFTGFWGAVGRNATDDYIFVADVDRNGRENLNALYRRTAAGLDEIVFPLEPVPGLPGRVWDFAGYAALDGAGRMAFTALIFSLDPPSPHIGGLFFWDGGDPEPVAVEDTPAPDGTVIYQFEWIAGLTDDGRIFFEAGSEEPPATGVFVATPAAAVPAFPPGVLPAIALGLLAASRAVRRRAAA
jgi:hypothetical protein